MKNTRFSTVAALGVVVAALMSTPLLASAQEPQVSQSITTSAPAGKQILRIGWTQDPKTLNPFVSLESSAYAAWVLNWDYLINLSPDDLSPTSGIAQDWTVSKDKRTVTFKLDSDNLWSDGEPITSADVKYSLEVLGKEGAGFAGYTSDITSIRTPDDETVVIRTSEPDTRIVGGLDVFALPKHVWGDVPVKKLTGSYQPSLPMVGSGPYIVTEFDHGRILRLKKNPHFRGEAPAFDEIQYIKYGNLDAAQRALKLGEVDVVPSVSPSNYKRLGSDPDIATVRGLAPSYTELAFNMCPRDICPDAKFKPAVQDRSVRQALGYAIDRDRINEIANRGTTVVGNGILPSFYKQFYEEPDQSYPYDPKRATALLDAAGWTDNGDDPRTKHGTDLSFDLYARSEAPAEIQAAKLITEQAAEVGIRFNVKVVSTDKLTDLVAHEVDGKPAPTFDAFVWGWGGDPDPSFLLSVLTTNEIGKSSDSFYSNPEYDRLYKVQNGLFDTTKRRDVIQQMVAITQEDLPYLVLTENTSLQAYRSDRLAGVKPTCLNGTGGMFCGQNTYAPFLRMHATAAAAHDGDQSRGILMGVLGGAAVLGVGLVIGVAARRRRRDTEPVEVEP